MTPLLRKILGMNWVLVLTMYGLLIFGVFSIESAARHIPLKDIPPEDLPPAIRTVAHGGALLDPSITRRLIGRFAQTLATDTTTSKNILHDPRFHSARFSCPRLPNYICVCGALLF